MPMRDYCRSSLHQKLPNSGDRCTFSPVFTKTRIRCQQRHRIYIYIYPQPASAAVSRSVGRSPPATNERPGKSLQLQRPRLHPAPQAGLGLQGQRFQSGLARSGRGEASPAAVRYPWWRRRRPPPPVCTYQSSINLRLGTASTKNKKTKKNLKKK